MRVTVRIQERVTADIAEWVTTPPGTPADRQLLLRHYLKDIITRLTDYDGIPPEAVRVTGIRPPLYWWQYSDDLWVQYAVRDRGWWLIGRERRVTIVRLATQPHGPGEP